MGGNKIRNDRIAANSPIPDVIENPYYGDPDDEIGNGNTLNTNIQTQDQEFAEVTVVKNLYYEQ